MTKRTVHMSLDVRGAIRNGSWKKRSDFTLVGCCSKDGKVLTENEILNELLDHVHAGHRVIPFCSTEECPDFDYQEGCPGHPVIESDQTEHDSDFRATREE